MQLISGTSIHYRGLPSLALTYRSFSSREISSALDQPRAITEWGHSKSESKYLDEDQRMTQARGLSALAETVDFQDRRP